MRGGIEFIRSRPTMWSLIWVAFVCTFLGIPIVVFLPVFARDVFGGDAGTFTLLLSVQALGAIAGALLVAWRGKHARLGREALLGLIVLGASEAGFAFSHRLVPGLVCLFIAGAALVGCFSMLSSLVQMMATDEMRGRVLSIYNIAFRGGMPIGSLATGALVPSLGAPLVLGLYGVVLACLALYLLLVERRLAAL